MLKAQNRIKWNERFQVYSLDLNENLKSQIMEGGLKKKRIGRLLGCYVIVRTRFLK